MRALILLIVTISSFTLYSQVIDSLVDVGGYNMHFNIIQGKGTPIIFEAGAGNSGSVWNSILEPIHSVTGTTLITYDRSGFGQSELNPNHTEDSDYGIVNGIEELEKGLQELGYDDDIILVSHSYGGLYNALYASRHPEDTKYVILIDAVVNSYWTDELLEEYHSDPVLREDFNREGMYYLAANYVETCRYMRSVEFPTNTPVLNIYAENIVKIGSEFENTDEAWNKTLKEYGDSRSNVKTILAEGSGHYIFIDNPGLIINAIIKAYIETLDENQQLVLLKKALDNAIDLSVKAKKYKHSEDDLNHWGYTLMQNDELERALEVFKLNTILYPESFNVYDSYGEALKNANRKEESILMYKKSIELNPENEHGKKMLQELEME